MKNLPKHTPLRILRVFKKTRIALLGRAILVAHSNTEKQIMQPKQKKDYFPARAPVKMVPNGAFVLNTTLTTQRLLGGGCWEEDCTTLASQSHGYRDPPTRLAIVGLVPPPFTCSAAVPTS